MNRNALAAVMFLLALNISTANAEVRLPAIFGDQMILQHGQPVEIWGWADAGEEVEVEFAGQQVPAKSDRDGRWRLQLDSLKPSDQPRPLVVRGSNTIKLTDVLVGEVWIASGQSNMAMTVRKSLGWDETQQSADDSLLRLFFVSPTGVSPLKPLDNCKGEWKSADTKSVANITAAGYYFARKLRSELKMPVGLIDCAWGGSCAEHWTSREALLSTAETQPLWNHFQQRLDAFDPATATPKAEAQELLRKFREAKALAFKNKTRLPRPPRIVGSPSNRRFTPSNMFNTMVHPLIPFGIRGVVWYQGESNRTRAEQYETLLPLMIGDWRKRWDRNEMSFGIVQLANLKDPPEEPQESEWAELQWAQHQVARKLPHTGLAVINDGQETSLHPREKPKVGHRLARWALAEVYGQKDIEYTGPLFREAQVDPGAIRIRFDHSNGLKTRDGKPLGGFQIAGNDRAWKWANAQIDGDSVVVSNESVAEPVAVRYAWSRNPTSANLTNASGLPASLFKTDDWPGLTHGRLVPEE